MELLDNIDAYRCVWKSIIRPPRQRYRYNDLGPRKFIVSGKIVSRSDFRLINSQGVIIECSIFRPEAMENRALPCVIYLHGNCSCRLEALSIMPSLLSRDIALCCFDFAGCGLSEGKWVSLGFHERNDLACVIDYLQEYENIEQIHLWGRSMGASTSLLYGNKGGVIQSMVLDSPFKNLEELWVHHAEHEANVPKILTRAVLKFIKKTIQEKANFNISDINPNQCAKNFNIPAYFIAAKEDELVPNRHPRTIYKNYQGEKYYSLIEGSHNSTRSDLLINYLSTWIRAQSRSLRRASSCASPGLPFKDNDVEGKIRSLRAESGRLKNEGDRGKIEEDDESRIYGDLDTMDDSY